MIINNYFTFTTVAINSVLTRPLLIVYKIKGQSMKSQMYKIRYKVYSNEKITMKLRVKRFRNNSKM